MAGRATLFFALSSFLLVAVSLVTGEYDDRVYENSPYRRDTPYCPPGYRWNYNRCERAYDVDYNRRRPYQPPQELVQPTPESCPPGFKMARGQCSKMTEREEELDRLPKEPCPPGQKRSRLVCRPYTYI